MKLKLSVLALLCGVAPLLHAANFHTPLSITSPNSTAFFPLANLYQGPGVGYSATAPHDALVPGTGLTWVTTNVAFPADYLASRPAPILVIDLGADQYLTEISTWGYSAGNANGVKAFSLRFATEAEGPGAFGTSIPNQGGFSALLSDVTRDSHPLTPVTARYVEFTATDNYWANGGNGPPPGGDRVGLGEIAFEEASIIVDPDILAPAQISLASTGAVETVDVPIANRGQQTLNLSGALISGANAAAFSIVAFPASVAPSGTEVIRIGFDPAGLPSGPVDAVLEFASNDPDSPSLAIPITGGVPARFYPIASVTSATAAAGADFYPAANLIQGSGVGFSNGWPHTALGEGPAFAWVTNAPNGGAGDYFSPLPTPSPVMVFDLGGDVALGEISYWGYANANANGASLFQLRFATSAEGPPGFGNSISYSPTFAPVQPTGPRQSFTFQQVVFARYVEWVPLDNFFGVNPPGGDRVGAGEIAFQITPGGNVEIVSFVLNSPTSASITFVSNTGSNYAVYRSPDLIDWSAKLADNLPGEAGTTTFTDNTLPPGTPRAFYRVLLR